ncbi:hypothetical protein EK21DRAFT_107356 [Setomelanomma holmii]|uniref:Rhodopsin domain-containing protein n=1 Tax=Setomelanomma holmii TaxID=210430 RepID=A0A9P4HJP1_9PLEO|nr:hypothetical protein EK21DRAFT_107356 [Setomelanomma holmii]
MDPSAAEPSYLPWDTSVGNQLAHYSSEDHSAPLWAVAILGLIYVLGVLLLRAYIKRHVLGWDDYLITASSAAALGYFVVIYEALRHDLGQVPSDGVDSSLQGKLIFLSRILLLVALHLAKLSTLAILHRIFVRDQKALNLLTALAFGSIVVSGLVSVFVGSIGCPHSALFNAHCSSQITRWSVITSLDVATEAPLRPSNPLKLRGVIIVSILHLNAFVAYTQGPPSPFHITTSLIYQQILLAVSFITATTPNMKAFLQLLSAQWGAADMRTYGNYGSRRNYGTGTYELKSMSSKQPRPLETEAEGPYDGLNLGAEAHDSTREAGDRASVISTSGGSQDLIIRKETTWTVVRS